MAIILASHGPGKLPLEAVQQAEKDYLRYRENYNRAWFEFGNLCIVSPLIFWV